MTRRSVAIYAPPSYCDRIINGEFVEGDWRLDYLPLAQLRTTTGRNVTMAQMIRDEIKEYVCNEGEVHFQYERL